MSDARRGELWLIELGEPLGHEQGWRRPALVISADAWNRHASTLVVIPVTRTSHELPTRVEIDPVPSNGLRAVSYARVEDVRSISAGRLVERMGQLDAVALLRVVRTLALFLDL